MNEMCMHVFRQISLCVHVNSVRRSSCCIYALVFLRVCMYICMNLTENTLARNRYSPRNRAHPKSPIWERHTSKLTHKRTEDAWFIAATPSILSWWIPIQVICVCPSLSLFPSLSGLPFQSTFQSTCTLRRYRHMTRPHTGTLPTSTSHSLAFAPYGGIVQSAIGPFVCGNWRIVQTEVTNSIPHKK